MPTSWACRWSIWSGRVLPALTILLWIFVPLYVRNNISTMPEYLERRFGGEARTLYAWLNVASYVFVNFALVFYTGGFALEQMWGIDKYRGRLAAGLLHRPVHGLRRLGGHGVDQFDPVRSADGRRDLRLLRRHVAHRLGLRGRGRHRRAGPSDRLRRAIPTSPGRR